jgi:hypothetical protein
MIGTSRAIRLKRSWIEKPRFYGAIVAEPGTRKSPALQACMQPVYVRQAAFLSEGGGGRRLVVDDATTEELVSILQRSPRGVLSCRDELTAWVHSMDAYRNGKGADRQFWLKLWSGGAVIVDRKKHSGQPICVSDPFVGVLGSIQPGVLKTLAGECATRDEDGFLHRVLFAYPQCTPNTGWSDIDLDPALEENWSTIINRLIDLPESAEPLQLSADGMEEWIDVYDTHVSAYRWQETYDTFFEGLLPPELFGVWRKLEGYLARVALTLHLLDLVSQPGYTPGGDEGQISASTVYAAEMIVDYFKEQACKVYGRLRVSHEDREVDKIVAFLQKNGGAATLSVIQNRCNFHLQSDVLKAVRRAEDRNIGTQVSLYSKDGRRKLKGFRLYTNEERRQAAEPGSILYRNERQVSSRDPTSAGGQYRARPQTARPHRAVVAGRDSGPCHRPAV